MIPKEGDIIFVHNKFHLDNPGTWMAPFIRSALSIDNTIEGRQPVYYNHCANIIEVGFGVLYVIEAGWNKRTKKAEVIFTLYSEWVKSREPGSFIICTPTFDYDKTLYKTRLIDSIGTPYYFAGVLLYQPLMLIIGKWFGKRSTEKLYCAQLSGYAYQLNNWYSRNPETLSYLFVK